MPPQEPDGGYVPKAPAHGAFGGIAPIDAPLGSVAS